MGRLVGDDRLNLRRIVKPHQQPRMDEDMTRIDHEGVERTVLQHDHPDRPRQPGGAQHRRGQFLQTALDLGVADDALRLRDRGQGEQADRGEAGET